MKTPTDIKNEIKKLQQESFLRSTSPEVVKKNKAKIEDLNTVLLYLETNPKEEKLKSQLQTLIELTNKLMERYFDWERTSTEAKVKKNPLQYYKDINDIPQKTKQIETLQFILS